MQRLTTRAQSLAWLWILASTACLDLDQEATGESKFVTMVQSTGDAWGNLSLLHKVHNPTITIRYRFSSDCAGKYNDRQVENGIAKVMRAWLQPVRDWHDSPSNKPVVDNFTFIKGDGDAETSDLDITFYCHEGRSKIAIGHWPSHIHLFEERGHYSLATLSHEVGHAFGLNDTYVGRSTGGDSECGHHAIVGCQPLSVMNVHHWLISDDSLHLGDDDVKGIRWLYRYLFTGEADCPRGFVLEDSTKGCVPENKFTYALQSGDLANAEVFLREKGLTINSQDEDGNTILHYIAQRAASHGSRQYRIAVKNYGASPDIRNSQGMTPLSLLIPTLEIAVEKRKLEIAEDILALVLELNN